MVAPIRFLACCAPASDSRESRLGIAAAPPASPRAPAGARTGEPTWRRTGTARGPQGRLAWNLSREGWLEPWVRVRETESDERVRLTEMPPMLVANGLAAVKPGATVLATVTDETGEEFPALVSQRFGAGRVATMAVGDMWRWGLHGEKEQADLARFWRQLARWRAAGKILRRRRNVYALAEPWRRVEPHPFVIANQLQAPSYVSLQSALSYHGMIPEAVPVTTSVTTGRPADFGTPLGRYLFRHVHAEAFFGYRRVAVLHDYEAFVADPAKALLDLVYLTPGGDTEAHLQSLRLSGLEAFDEETLRGYARRWGKRKILRAADVILRLKRSNGDPGWH